MKNIRAIAHIILLLIVFASCDRFIRDEEILILNDYEKQEYRLKKDIKRDEAELKKGTVVKLLVRPSDDSIKVYCYSAAKDFLKAERILIIYVFREDFKEEIFDLAVFEKRLYDIVEPGKKLKN